MVWGRFVRLLLDTHVVFWTLMKVPMLSEKARQALEDDRNTIYVSVATAWEIAIKVGLGKWPEATPLIEGFEQALADAQFELLQISLEHARSSGLMQGSHRDPFDRLLVAQASVEDLTLVTSDAKVRLMGVPCLW